MREPTGRELPRRRRRPAQARRARDRRRRLAGARPRRRRRHRARRRRARATTRTAARRPRRSPATTSAPSAAPRPRAGPAAGDAIPEQGGSDARSHRRPHQAPRASTSARGCAAASGSLTGACSPGRSRPERHRALQLGMLHEHTGGLVELAAGARRDGRLQITTRRRAGPLPARRTSRRGRLAASDCWRSPRRHADAGEEVFLAPAVRAAARGDKHAVSETRFLWVDVDRARRAAGAVGVPRRAALPSAHREQRRSRARVLEARPSRCRRLR